jgi:hypothetical protein
MNTYQLQFRATDRRWRGGPTFQMVGPLFRGFLDYLDSVTLCKFGAVEDDEYRIIRINCHNPQYRYNGSNNIIDLRGFNQT